MCSPTPGVGPFTADRITRDLRGMDNCAWATVEELGCEGSLDVGGGAGVRHEEVAVGGDPQAGGVGPVHEELRSGA